MKPSLIKPFRELSEQKEIMLSRIASYNVEQQKYKHTASEWSMLQVVKHLIQAESLTLGYINKKIATGQTLRNAGFKSFLRYYLVYLFLKFKKKIKAPSQLPHPTDNQTLDELIHEWNKIRADIEVVLNQIPDDIVYKEIFRHPVAGFINLVQTVAFLRDHLLHHQQQIKRISQSHGFKALQ